ncbi:HD domain-containing protein [Hominifimenecus sp. rT4P-3]|uniref:HD domain-containing protein n=1 Tax=Hominifimenecus sp. rT4P-3 TaxID=3242979 RepID=UPI003DA51068
MKTDFSRDELVALIPQIEQIEDAALRDKVVKAWELAYQYGNFENLKTARFNPFCDYVTLCQHTRSVTEGSICLAKILQKEYQYDIDMDAVISIAALHDISKLLENTPKEDGGIQKTEVGRSYQHGFFSAYYSLQAGLPHKISAAILAHTHQTKTLPTSLEGILVTYADLSDADAHRFYMGKTLHVSDLH